MRYVRATLFGSLVIASFSAAAAAALLAIEDLYLFDEPVQAALSPQGSQLAYIRQWVDQTYRNERTSLWLVAQGPGSQRAAEKDEPDARGPVYSPDGKWIAFRSTRVRPHCWKQTPPVPSASDPAVDIWLIKASGGTAIPLAGPRKPYGRVFADPFYGRMVFSRDGKRLLFVADAGNLPQTPEEQEADVLVLRKDQGEGYGGYGPAQVWVAELDFSLGEYAAANFERLTDDDVWYGDPQWSADERSILVCANRTSDREAVRFSINKDYEIWSIDVATRSLAQLTTGPGPDVSPRLAPDGRRLAYLSSPRKGPHADIFNLVVMNVTGDDRQAKVVLDYHGPSASDAPPPVFPLPENCWDGPDHLVYQAFVGTAAHTIRLDLKTGKHQVLADSDKAASARSQFAKVATRRSELTPPGNLFLRDRDRAQVQVVRWTSSDGTPIEGVLTLPPAEVAKAPFKLIVNPHGGPHGRSTAGFNFTSEVFAGHGYAVLQPNFRGSLGYGREFLDADRKDLGGGDMQDVLSGIDYLVREKIVKKDPVFVYGSSYGGFMTTWLVGHTDRFTAAVAQNAVTDLDVMWATSDIQSWTEWELGGRPWEVREAMRKHSPITYVDKVQTPTLILHSRDDRRVPIVMGQMYYQALVARGIKTQMVIYPGEGHTIRQPRHRENVLRRTLAWFEQSAQAAPTARQATAP